MNPLDVKFKAKIKNSNILVNVIKIDFSNQKVYIGIDKQLWEEAPEDIDFPNFVNDFEDIEELLPYTGFKDEFNKNKEDNLIYVGDIVLLMDKTIVTCVGVVEDKWGGYFVKDEMMSDALERGVEFSIEGNIYENPDLLEELEEWDY